MQLLLTHDSFCKVEDHHLTNIRKSEFSMFTLIKSVLFLSGTFLVLPPPKSFQDLFQALS